VNFNVNHFFFQVNLIGSHLAWKKKGKVPISKNDSAGIQTL